MNIKEAKEQIKRAMIAYFTKDEFGNYVIPVEKQRPVFLMGAPGIGKTAIMEQIAEELNVGLVSYSMTHHTRQSALGLPFITTEEFDGTPYRVSEYTMSEIIASVYKIKKETGHNEGILFLDEINCVSETLAPSMLQFLQFKIFGTHKLPEGWIVVTAGNPPEYNRSVKEYDIVTWDRLKRIDVEPNYPVWREYAVQKGIHGAILTFLEIKNESFYLVESTVDGKQFVTARGWEDLSEMMKLYELHNLPVDRNLISQYLQSPQVAKEFAIYYDLYAKYRSDYQIPSILQGQASDTIKTRAKAARFDERLALLELLLDGVQGEMEKCVLRDMGIRETLGVLRNMKEASAQGESMEEFLTTNISAQKQILDQGKNAHSLSRERQYAHTFTLGLLTEVQEKDSTFDFAKASYDQVLSLHKAEVSSVQQKLDNMFAFLKEVYGEGQELLVVVTELTVRQVTAKFISKFGSEAYHRESDALQFYERKKELLDEINKIEE